MRILTAFFASAAAAAAASPSLRSPIVVHVVADDLGYNDLGFMNGNKTHTPHVNRLVRDGVLLTQYHTYKVCSPSRAAIMTGRYPWGVGYYDMLGPEMVPLNFVMLPQLLADAGWSTHAVGKWNLGNTVKDFTPTFRGFDTFFGYYNAALKDYWWHGGGTSGCNPPFSTDLSNSSGRGDPAGVRHASDALNGTYDQELFTAEAVRLITAHHARVAAQSPGDLGSGTYLYLAYQNVHTTGQDPVTISGSQPFQAPCHTVDSQYGSTATDAYKVLGAMVTELDYGVGNVTAALEEGASDWLLILTADNGGPINLGNTNAPLRGGKHTFWDGGLRVMSFVSGSMLPPAVRGTKWSGLAHASDWYRTIAEGVAGLPLPSTTGPRPLDGVNLWPALTNRAGNSTSPRTEVIHQVVNQYTAAEKLADPATIRVGHFKLILGDPGDASYRQWPAPLERIVPFGQSNGSRDAYPIEQHGAGGKGLQHCRSPHIEHDDVTGFCRGSGCLFDLSVDETESHNLINDTRYASVVAQLRARLAEAGATGPPWAFPVPKGNVSTVLNQEICSNELATGYFEPVRTSLPPIPPPTPAPPPTPEPVWKPCIQSLTKHCPYSHPPNLTKCEACGAKFCNRTVTIDKYCQRAP